MKFQFNKKNEKDINEKDFLLLLIWSNIYYLELNEFLYCIQYYKEKKLFGKVNIYNEILKAIKIYEKNNAENEKVHENPFNINDEYVLQKFMSILISIFIEQCLQNPKIIKKAREIIPNMYNINERKQLLCKELYTFIEISSIYDALEKEEINDEKEFLKKIKNILEPFKNIKDCYKIIKDNNKVIGNEYINNNYQLLFMNIKSAIKPENIIKAFNLYIQILLHEDKKFEGNEFFLNVLINNLLKDKFKLIKYSHIIFHEILSKYVSGKNIFINKIINFQGDSFLKIIKENIELMDITTRQYFEEIILEVFETKFNAYFEGFKSHNNNCNKQKNIQGKSNLEILIEKENLNRFEQCIELLEDKYGALSSERFVPNIFYSAYIKYYIYEFIFYTYYQFEKETKEQQIINRDYINQIITAIRGKNNKDINSRTRKVIEIYTFRLLYYFLNKDYKKFKQYDFDSKLLSYISIFTGKESIEEESPKFIDFCGKSIEDFINIPDETPKEQIEEQNFYTHSLLSIKSVGRASSKNGIISKEDYNDIWNYFLEKSKKKKLNIDLKIEDIFLSFNLIDSLSDNLADMISEEKKIFEYVDNQNNSVKYNNKYIGIMIYALRICFHSYTIDNGFDRYFYSKLINPKNQKNKDIIKLINDNYIPGFNRGNKGIEKRNLEDFLNNNDYKIKIYDDNDNDNEIQIKPLTIVILKFIFHCHLLFAILINTLEKKKLLKIFLPQKIYHL